MKSKRLIILIPHYNNPIGLKDSLLSIQEDFDIDIMIVDDGSKVKFNETEIKNCYQKGEIYFEYLSHNLGCGEAINHGLKKIRELGHELIARFDCGDFCLPNKFYKQLNYLNNHPDIKLLGTWGNVVNEKRELLYILKHPAGYDAIKSKMYLNSAFIHPSVIFHSNILDVVGYYPYKYRHAAQDYAFFFNIIKRFKAENFPEALIDYVVEEKSISSKKRKLQVKNRILIILEYSSFNFYLIYSLSRNVVLYFIPRSFAEKIKYFFAKK